MNLLKKLKKRPNISSEDEKKVKSLSKQAQKTYNELEKMPDGTKEKGDKLLEYIRIKEEQFKIKTTLGDRQGLWAVKQLYKAGIRQGKWKR